MVYWSEYVACENRKSASCTSTYMCENRYINIFMCDRRKKIEEAGKIKRRKKKEEEKGETRSKKTRSDTQLNWTFVLCCFFFVIEYILVCIVK